MHRKTNSPDPILIKRHHLQDIENFQRLILLVRDPREVIVRNLDSLSDAQFVQAYLDDVQLWAWQLRIFGSWTSSQRLLVNHDQLAAADTGPFTGIARFLGHPDPEAAASGFLAEQWARSFDALQDAAPSRDRPNDYWQQTRPDRADLVTKAMKGLSLPSLGAGWEWLDSEIVQSEMPQRQAPIPPRSHGPGHQSRPQQATSRVR